MTKEEMNIAIAELRGWEICPDEKTELNNWWRNPLVSHLPFRACDLPDYASDLNTMHEAEKDLNSHDYWRFVEILRIVVIENREDFVADRSSATAVQRAEAFLKTKGLWVG